ncbi:MAG TPA: cysteine desulfurase family protein [Bacillaceae bacterium]|nr:cysteine desulfurase family protein [Bacillaceae bacterium]
MNTIYLDHAATSPIHPQVIEVMTEAMKLEYGNPSSIHAIGRSARRVLDESRTTLAKSIGAKFSEIIFTSGGTEADNLAIIGSAMANRDKGNHIITTKLEHHAVLHSCQYLEKQGFDITYLSPDEHGLISVESVRGALRSDTILVTIMYGNNEVGAIQPMKDIAAVVANHQALLHTDAVQAFGAIQIDITDIQVDMLSVSSHKINGPKGIGFLYVRTGTKLLPVSFGGEQELKRRAGTENLPAIVGFAEACRISINTIAERKEQYLTYKKRFVEILKHENIEYYINGNLETGLPHVLNISFPGTDVESLLVNLDIEGIAVSSGSACTAGSIEPSHVLVAMFGNKSERIRNSIRFSFGLGNDIEHITIAAEKTAAIVKRLRN